MVKSAKEGMKLRASNSEIYGRMHAVFVEMEGGAHSVCARFFPFPSKYDNITSLPFRLMYFHFTTACCGQRSSKFEGSCLEP